MILILSLKPSNIETKRSTIPIAAILTFWLGSLEFSTVVVTPL